MSYTGRPDVKEIVDVLLEHYYSIGILSGHEAIGNMIDDYFSGYLDTNLIDWEITDAAGEIDREFFKREIFWAFAKSLFDSKNLFVAAWYQPRSRKTESLY